MKFNVTINGSRKEVSVKADTAEQAAVKGAAKHFFGFKAKTAVQKSCSCRRTLVGNQNPTSDGSP